MEQTPVMDKKNSYRAAPAPFKLNQESTKTEYARKRNSQAARKKDLDRNEKAPPSRGRTGQRNVRSREKVGGQVDSQNWEVGSIHLSGRKKQRDITHQIICSEYRPHHRQENHYNNNSGKRSKHCAQFTKEHYLQANCQFVVAAGNDYSSYERNPDQLVDWDLIEEVWLHCMDPPDCPICLYPPVSAKITKCGHIFCCSCMLHYLALSDSKWRNCPICSAFVEMDNLKSVVPIKCKNYNIGQEIEMTLMKRDADSLVPVAACSSEAPKSHPYSTFERSPSNLKLIIAADDEVDKYIIGRELKELNLHSEREGDEPESCFIHQALLLLNARRQRLLENSAIGHFSSLSLCDRATPMHSVTEDGDGMKTQMGKANSLNDRDGPKPTYFYQATDGSHVYLHSLNVNMLMKEYNDWNNFPPTIRGTIVEKDSISMTSVFRERFRYLKHLPLCCSFDIMELELTEPTISASTVSGFKETIKERERKRKQRDKEADKIEQRVRLEENKMLGRCERWADVYPDSRTQFPDFSREPSIVSEECVVQQVAASQYNGFASSDKSRVQSFAQMTKNSKKAVASKPQSEWPSLSPRNVLPASDDDDGSYSAPAYNTTFWMATAECTTSTDLTQPAEKQQSKRKKKKKVLLFSTGGQKI